MKLMKPMNRTQFLNLIKQYWKSNPEKSFEDIIGMFIKMNKENVSIMTEDEAKLKIQTACLENSLIDNFEI